MIRLSLINLFLRGITQLSKFVLLFYMAKELTADDMGLYSIIASTISIAIYFIGFDFYNYNTRELLGTTNQIHPKLLRDQLIFHLLTYIIIFPLIYLIFIIGVIPREYALFFYLLLFFEHLSQEANRVLITLSKPLIANLVLFIRSGVWIYVIIMFPLFGFGSFQLSYIWIGWIAGGFLSLICTAFALPKMNWKFTNNNQVDWYWIYKGIKVSLPLFISTIALKVSEFSDRYFIQYYHGNELVGIYFFFFSIANILSVFVSTGIISILYPKIIKSVQNNQKELYTTLNRKLIKMTISSILLLSLIIFISIETLLRYVGKGDFVQYLPVLYILLVGVSFNILSQVPHIILFAKKLDKEIIISTVFSLFISILMNFILTPKYGVSGAAISLTISMFSLLIFKFLFLYLNNNRSIK